MGNLTTNQSDKEIISLAVAKIKKETEEFKGGNKEKAVSTYVSNILQNFCNQDVRFAKVVYRFKRTLSDCCANVMKDVGNYISDIDVYRGATKFYFPNAEIKGILTIEVIGEAPNDDEILKEEPKGELKHQNIKKIAKKKSDKLKKHKNTNIENEGPIQLSLF